MATLTMIQCGRRLVVECQNPSFRDMIDEAGGSAWSPWDDQPGDVHVIVSSKTGPFDVTSWDPLTRGAYSSGGTVVVTNACGSGFDLRLSGIGTRLVVEARYRPPARERLAALAMRWRAHLLSRAALLQYPALWAAGLVGLAPLHAAAVTTDRVVLLLAGPGGCGRSTLLLGELAGDEHAVADNVSVSDGTDVYGLVEPVRIEGGGGRAMPHGRAERELPGRVEMLQPDRLVLLRRENRRSHVVRPASPERAAQILVAGTYMAGELRRYWPFAATLALGTGRGPVHPPIQEVADRIAAQLPATEVILGVDRSPPLRAMLAELGEVRS
jgi:hypothetical protein